MSHKKHFDQYGPLYDMATDHFSRALKALFHADLKPKQRKAEMQRLTALLDAAVNADGIKTLDAACIAVLKEWEVEEDLDTDPKPGLHYLGGIVLHARDKHFLNEAAYIAGCLALEGAIKFGRDGDESLSFAIVHISRALFAVKHDLAVDDPYGEP